MRLGAPRDECQRTGQREYKDYNRVAYRKRDDGPPLDRCQSRRDSQDEPEPG